MSEAVESRRLVLFDPCALAQVRRSGGPFVFWRWIAICFGYVLVRGDLDVVEKVIMLQYHSRFVVDVERQIHVGKVTDEVFQHHRRGVPVPRIHVTTASDLDDLAIADGGRDQGIVVSNGFSCPLAYHGRLQRPKRK